MIKKTYVDMDVVTAARKRIKNIFSNGVPVYFSVSGGKDSICLNHLIYDLCRRGEIDKSLLTIDFIDEEAMFPCVIDEVKRIRQEWQDLGVTFRWWCIQVKHFNCLNSLEQDETFICWDARKRGRWVRPMPHFARTNHALLREGVDAYQDFLPRINRGGIQLIGVRVAESVQRYQNVATRKSKDIAYPIYDWLDTDVWHYIAQYRLRYPVVYEHLYRVGKPIRGMRVSQFFSVDTIASLPKMAEYYPGLYDRICQREPNAYMVSMYYDTEMYRRAKRTKKGSEPDIDYKAKVLSMIGDDSLFDTPMKAKLQARYKHLITFWAPYLDQKLYKQIHLALVGGDPKDRHYRAIHNAARSASFGRKSKNANTNKKR